MPPTQGAFVNFLKKNIEFLDLNLGLGVDPQSDKFRALQSTIGCQINAQLLQMQRLNLDDANAALELIKHAPLAEDMRALLVDRMGGKILGMAEGNAPPTTKLQVHSYLHNYLTEGDWQQITTSTDALRCLAYRCSRLGLHHPSEKTSQKVVAIALVNHNAVGAAALHAIRDFKAALQSYNKNSAVVDTFPTEFPILPTEFQASHPLWYVSSFHSDAPVPCKYDDATMMKALAMTPCRATNKIAKQPEPTNTLQLRGGMRHDLPALYQAADQAGRLFRAASSDMLPGLEIFQPQHAAGASAASMFSQPVHHSPPAIAGAPFALGNGSLLQMQTPANASAEASTSQALVAKTPAAYSQTPAEALVALLKNKAMAHTPPIAKKAKNQAKKAVLETPFQKKPSASNMKKPAAASMKKPAAARSLEPIALGCSKCRYLFRGCAQCRDPAFTGKRGCK
jgi:hypothetical protein